MDISSFRSHVHAHVAHLINAVLILLVNKVRIFCAFYLFLFDTQVQLEQVLKQI